MRTARRPAVPPGLSLRETRSKREDCGYTEESKLLFHVHLKIRLLSEDKSARVEREVLGRIFAGSDNVKTVLSDTLLSSVPSTRPCFKNSVCVSRRLNERITNNLFNYTAGG
jgi:hypothetical protein